MATSLRITYTGPQVWTLVKIPSSNYNSVSFCFSSSRLSAPLLHLRRTREVEVGRSVVTRAGPSTNQFVFAFVFPLSLLLVTVFTAFQIGNRVEQKFLEELAMNEALREEEEEEDELAEVPISRKEEPALPQSRNRPRREV